MPRAPRCPQPASTLAPQRRLVLRRAALLTAGAAALFLGGCGFKLSQPAQMGFRTVALSGFAANSPLAIELARALEASGVDVVETSAQAAALAAAASAPGQDTALMARHVILQSLGDTRDQGVASSTAFGQVRDMTLTTRFKFRLLRADGSVLLPLNELSLSRDVTFNEKDALAKQDEFDALYRAMQSDLVAQALRRLAVVRPEQLLQP